MTMAKHPILRIYPVVLALLTQAAWAESDWEDARERLRDLRSWDELCAVEDCSQFPAGYATYQIGPDLYYFPHYDTLIERPPAVYSVRPGRFVEYSDEGELVR